MKSSSLLVSLLLGIFLVGGGSFYGGMRYAQSTSSNTLRTRPPQMGFRSTGTNGNGMMIRGGVPGGGFTVGEILSRENQQLTLKLRDGGSRVVFVSTSTRIGQMTDGTLTDLNIGTEISVNGTTNADGSITASVIQLRSMLPEHQPKK